MIYSVKSCIASIFAVTLVVFVALPAQAQVKFKDVTNAAGFDYWGESWGASWGDLNSDGLPDIFVNHHRAKPSLYINQGDGTFTDIVASTFWNKAANVSDMHGGSWADFDNDGDQDFYVTHGSRHQNHFMVNEKGVLRYRTPQYDLQLAKQRGRLPVWLDFSNDGSLDYLVTSENIAPLARQNATTFINRTAASGIDCNKRQMGFLVDVNLDGTLDLICSGATFPGRIYNFRRGVPFTELKRVMPSTGATVDVAIGDFDNNLKNDFFLVRGAKRLSGANLLDSNTVAAQLITLGGGEKRVHFKTNGDLKIKLVVEREFSKSDVSIGANGWNPNATVKKVGGERTMVLKLSSSDPRVVGIKPHNTSKNRDVFIGYKPGTQTWTIANSPGGKWTFLYAEVVSTKKVSNVSATGLNSRDRPMQPALVSHKSGGFKNIATNTGLGQPIGCVSAVAADFDNDMDMDIYAVCRGAIFNVANRLYINDGKGNFTVIPGAGGAAGPAGGRVGKGENVVTADYDVDGNVDLFVTNGLALNPERVGGPDKLFRNLGHPTNKWIQLDLVGKQSNRDGIGARVFVSASGRTQLREQGGGYHRWAQNDKRLHFGLGTNGRANVTVEWPSGIIDTFQNVAANAVYKVNEGGAIVEYIPGKPTGGSGCGPAAGKPTYSFSDARAIYLWRENCSSNDWKMRVTGGTQPDFRFVGNVQSTLRFTSVNGVQLESADVVDTSISPTRIRYDLLVGASGQDGINFTVDPASSTCFGQSSNIAKAFVGRDRTPVAVPFDLDTLEPCGGSDGTPDIQITDWVRAKGGVSVSGSSLSYSGNPTGWNSNTVNSVPLSNYGVTGNYSVRWKIGSNPSATTWIVGLGIGETTANWRDVDFGFRSSAGRLSVYEKGVWRTDSKILVNGDVLEIHVGNKQLEYRVNGNRIYSRPIQGNESFYIDSSFNDGFIRLNNFSLITD